MSDYKEPRQGFFIHLLAFITATFVSNVITKLMGLILFEADPAVLVFYVNPIIIFFTWPTIISWFRLNNNEGLALYLGVFLVGSPYALWWYFSSIYDAEVVKAVIHEPGASDTFVAIALTFLIYWRLRKIDERHEEEYEEYRRHKEIRQERIKDREEEEKIARATTQTKPVSVDLPPSATETYTNTVQNKEVDDEVFYKAALDEYEDDERVPETWAKALTLCKGEQQCAKWKYVELRVEWLLKHQ